MAYNKVQLQAVFLGGVLAYSSLLQPALAHANHPRSPEPETADTEEEAQPIDEASSDVTEAIESQSTPTQAEVSAPVVSTAKLNDGFSFGFGEAIFGLMIATPFLLLSLRRGHR